MLKNSVLKAGIIYVILGTAVFGFIELNQKTAPMDNAQILQNQSKTTHSATLKPTQTVTTGKPIKLSIPRLHITLAIVNGIYNATDKTWSLTNDKAQFATVTVQPNNVSGNTLIYGHDTPAVLQGTDYLAVGDELLIYTDNGHIFRYSYQGSTITLPTDTSIFAYSGPPQVTLLTCNGWFSTHRRLMFFTFINIDQ